MSTESELLVELTKAVSELANSSSSAGSSATLQAVSIKLPEFWSDDPEVWFVRVEAQLRSKFITADQTKFDYVTTALDNRAASEVKSVLLNPPEQGKYQALKTALLNAFGKSQMQKDSELLNISGLGDRKPSAFLRYLESLNNDAETLRRAFFLAQLPSQVRAILAVQEFQDLHELAIAADRIIEANDLLPNHQSMSTVYHKPARRVFAKSKPQLLAQSTICFYHKKFGPKARHCRPGCPFETLDRPTTTGQENDQAGRQ